MLTIPYVSEQPVRPAIHDAANNLGFGKVRLVKSKDGKGIHFGVETHTEVWTYSPNMLLAKPNMASLLHSAIRLYINPEQRAVLNVDYVVTSDLSKLTGNTWVIDIETAGDLDGEPEDRPQLSIGIWDGNADNPVHVIPGDQYPENLGELLSSKNLIAHNCFNGDTEIITREGNKTLAECYEAGEVEVWTRTGWIKAPVLSFGEQPVNEVTLGHTKSRFGMRKKVTVTDNHRWILREGTVTTDLKEGDQVISEMPRYKVNENSEAFKHGLIFADGTRQSGGRDRYQMRLCGPKSEYKELFDTVTYPKTYGGDPMVYLSSVRELKKLPWDESAEYIYNFVQGWARFDGTGRPGKTRHTTVITTISTEAKEFLETYSAFCGYMLVGVSEHKFGKQSFSKEGEPFWVLSITEDIEELHWTVKSIVKKGSEEVFCPVVPKEESFTLRGGLYTGNCQFDLKDLNYWLGTELRARHDTMVMHYALHSGAGAHGLKALCRLYLGVDDWDRDAKKYTTRGKDYSNIPSEILYEYNAKDVYYTAKLWQFLHSELGSEARRFYEKRMKQSHFLQSIEESKGIYIDVPYFQRLDKEMSNELNVMLENIPVNPNSPKQVKELFGTKSSDEKTLKGLIVDEHPKADIAQRILDFRKTKKLHGTYVVGILKRVKDSYIHPRFKITATVTGRLASENPNAQTIPRTSPIKRGLCAPPGYKVVSADYSQIEARVMAVLSGDKNMQSVFQKDSPDFFDVLIPSMFPEEFATYEDYRRFKYDEHDGHDAHYRTIAKGIVYGLSFGRQAKAIGEATGLTEAEAQKIINNYFKAYPDLYKWRKGIAELVKTNSLYALTGMRFQQEIYWPNPVFASGLERSALSFMPQHHANECLLGGMMLFQEKLDPEHGYIHGLIHDDGKVYIKEEYAEHYAQLLSECMEKSATDLLGDAVVFPAEPVIKDSWEEEDEE